MAGTSRSEHLRRTKALASRTRRVTARLLFSAELRLVIPRRSTSFLSAPCKVSWHAQGDVAGLREGTMERLVKYEFGWRGLEGARE